MHDHDDGTGHRQLTTSGQARYTYTIDRERKIRATALNGQFDGTAYGKEE